MFRNFIKKATLSSFKSIPKSSINLSYTASRSFVSIQYKLPINIRTSSRALSTNAEQKENSEESTAAPEVNETTSEEAVTDTEEDPTSQLNKQVKDLQERVKRELAEQENVRRIARLDVEKARDYANVKFAQAMLEVADDLDRALASVPDRSKLSEDSALRSLVEGVEMVDKNLHKILGQFGIEEYGKVDEVFDPNRHDALFEIPDADKEPGTIGQVLKTGYVMKERVIRAAQVGTRRKP